VEGLGLEAERFEMHSDAIVFARILLSLEYQLSSPARASEGLIDPEKGNVEPAAPDPSRKAAKNFAIRILPRNGNRVVRLDPGLRGVVAQERHVESFRQAVSGGLLISPELAIRHTQVRAEPK